MIAIAAQQLEVKVIVLSDQPTDPAAQVTSRVESLAELATACDLITFENEFVDLTTLANLTGIKFLPSLASLSYLLDKFDQRQFLATHQIPQPQFALVKTAGELQQLAEKWGGAVVLKTCRYGYDGKGTRVITRLGDLLPSYRDMGGAMLLAEEFIPFERELAIMVAREESGGVCCYPVIETIQRDQVCIRAIAPAQVSAAVSRRVQEIALQVADALDLVGIVAIELFLTKDGRVLVNEIAPRVHNSAHLTIEACHTSQFSQVVRLACGMGLGDPELKIGAAVMVNLLGYAGLPDHEQELKARLSNLGNTYLHWYKKAKSLPGRKLGHVTVTATHLQQAIAQADLVEQIWYG